MSLAEWRALIEAFLSDRLSAEAFERRFMQAWRAQRDAGERIPPAIDDLLAAVEAFGAEQDRRSDYEADETSLREAARQTLRMLKDDERTAPKRTFDRARAREDMMRARAYVGQIAGFGCLAVLAWLVLMVLQINYAIEQVNSVLKIGVWFSSILGFFLAFVPVLGNFLAFFGAKDVGGWSGWAAALVFLILPLAAFGLGGWRWRRWRERWRRR